MSGSPFSLCKNGVKVAVRVTPKASRDKIDGVTATAEGDAVVKVAVRAVPEDGKANDAVLKLLAKAWGRPKSNLEVIAGGASRSKTVLVGGPDPDDILMCLNAWVIALE